MILIIIAAILTLLILRKIGVLKGDMSTLKGLALMAILFAVIRGLLKLFMPIFILLWAIFFFDVIIWAGVNVFCHHDYTLATWRFIRSVFLNQPF